MKQADLRLNLTVKRIRKREFLAQMECVVPWAALVQLVAPYAPEGKKGRPPFSVETMLRVHFMQQRFTLSDPAVEEALHHTALFREFAGLSWDCRIPDESVILRFRHLLEKHQLTDQILAQVNDLLRGKGLMLKAGTVVDATLISAPSSTKNASGYCDTEIKQSRKGNQPHFGMKGHISVGAESGLVHIAARPSGRKTMKAGAALSTILDKIERLKASVRAKVKHPFRVIKRQFGQTKVRYRGLFKNTAQLKTLFALSNLWMARRKLMALDGQVRLHSAKTA